MLVYFHKPCCIRHRLPFQYICKKPNCKCPIRMCSYCAQQHSREQDFENEIAKQDEQGQKLVISLQLFPNYYGYLEKYHKPQTSVSSLDKRNLQSKQIDKNILLALNDEKNAVNIQLNQFNSQHFQMKKQMKKLKISSFSSYLSLITAKQLVQPLIQLSSDKGLQKISNKVLKAHQAKKKYQEIYTRAQKFGTNKKQFLNALGFEQEYLLKSKIKTCLGNITGNVKKQVIQDGPREHFNPDLKFKNIEKRRKEAQIRRYSPKKLTIVTTSRRARAISDKQN